MSVVFDKVLNYANKGISNIPAVFEKLYGSQVEQLDLSFNEINRITSLDGFSILRELILDNNKLNDTTTFPFLPQLRTLSMNNNKFSDIVVLVTKLKHCFPNLTFLSLLGNPACAHQISDSTKDDNDYRRYRYLVLHYLRNLKFLDSTKVTSYELEEAILKGHLMHVKKPKLAITEMCHNEVLPNNSIALPKFSRDIGEHRGAYTTFKYRYANRESEGNRFILNDDL